MEFTCYYYYIMLDLEERISFIKKDDLIRIDQDGKTITVPFEKLKEDEFLYGYYLLSQKLTPDPTNVVYTDGKWVVECEVIWKYHTTKMNCFEFDEDPRNFTLTKSTEKEYDEFYCDLQRNPYEMIKRVDMHHENLKKI